MSGMTLNVDDNLVQPIVQAEIQAAIVRQFEQTPNILREVVLKILCAKVDSDGKPSSYNGSSTYLEWLCKQAIREATTCALKQYLDGHKDELNKEIERQLVANKKELAMGLIAAITSAVDNRWRFNVSIEDGDR